MTRRELLLQAAAAPAARRAASAPNFVFIISDDHHYQCLGAAGNPHISTPRLDALARRGVLFSQGIISTPQCGPSRGILLSGRESSVNGLRSNGQLQFGPDPGPTVVEQLRRSGYDTALVGKWHIRPRPAECGFSSAPLWLPGGGSRYVNPELRRGFDGALREEAGHITGLFTEAGVQVIREARRPYLLWLAYNAPHTPWTAVERFQQPYVGKPSAELAPPAHPRGGRPFDWSTYYAVISHLDDAVGRVVAAVEESGQWRNTVIVLLGDNGFLCGTKNLNGKVRPWEESIRVPMLAAGGPVRAGVRTDCGAASVDWPATLLDLAGLRPERPLHGRSLRPVLESGRGGPAESFAVWDDPAPNALTAGGGPVEPYRLVRTATHKLIVWASGRQALYHHPSDPGEENDLSAQPASPPLLEDLRKRLRSRLQATGDAAAAWLT